MKKCPSCAEEIQEDAIKCRYCGEQFQKLLNLSKRPTTSWLFGSIGLVAFLMSNFIPAIIAPFAVLAALCLSAMEIKQGSKTYGAIVLVLSLVQAWVVIDHFAGLSASLGPVNVKHVEPPVVEKYREIPKDIPADAAQVNVKHVEPPAVEKYRETPKDIPADAAQIIRQECAREWSDDYRMRNYCERQQRAGIETLEQNRPSDVPADAFRVIRGKCATEWPRDFRMRAYCETQQYDGYRSLGQSNSLDRDAVRAKCAQQWPDDFRMRDYCERRGG